MRELISAIALLITVFSANAQFTESELELELVSDSSNKFDFPYLSLNKKGTAAAICPCFAYEIWNGHWQKKDDSTYLISLVETPRDYSYRMLAVDSTPYTQGTLLVFKNSKGKVIKDISIETRSAKQKHKSNAKGEILLTQPYNTNRYYITTEPHVNDSMFALLMEFSANMSYTITLSELKCSFEHTYYLREANNYWAISDAKDDKHLGWFSVFDISKFYKKN